MADLLHLFLPSPGQQTCSPIVSHSHAAEAGAPPQHVHTVVKEASKQVVGLCISCLLHKLLSFNNPSCDYCRSTCQAC
jgi:hypothetical protein